MHNTPSSAAIVAIGNEVLNGSVVNTNAAFIALQLTALGIAVESHAVVQDQIAAIAKTVKHCLETHTVVILTGGLGPTDDDLTAEGLALTLNFPLVEDLEMASKIERIFQEKNMAMAIINRRQARRPERCTFFNNPVGTAPGITYSNSQSILLAFPGVPRELEAMWPAAAGLIGEWFEQYQPVRTQPIFSTLYLTGLGESELVSRLTNYFKADYLKKHPLHRHVDENDPNRSKGKTSPEFSYATYVTSKIIRLEIQTHSNSSPEAMRTASQDLNAFTAKIKAAFLKYVLPFDTDLTGHAHLYNPDTMLAAALCTRLKNAGHRLSIAESCTGGLISSLITDVPGSSAVTVFNGVAYGNAEKTSVLGVSAETLEREGAVSKAVALEMAQGILKLSQTDVALAITGIAGPSGGTAEKPVGTAWVAVVFSDPISENSSKNVPENNSMPEAACHQITLHPQLSRQTIKQGFAQQALLLVYQLLYKRNADQPQGNYQAENK